jgi:hypothetical protein
MSIRSDFSNSITPIKKLQLNDPAEKTSKRTQPIIKIDKNNNTLPKESYAQKYQ